MPNKLPKWLMGVFVLAVLAAFPLLSPGVASQQKSASEASQDPSNPDVYVKIGDQVLHLRYNEIFGLFKDGKTVSKQDQNSIDHPLVADRMSFMEEISLPGYTQTYTVQYQLNSAHTDTGIVLSKIKEALASEEKSLKALPKHGQFYKYTYSKEYNLYQYISANKTLVNSNGDPLVLKSYGNETSVLEYSIAFNWRSNIRVHIRENESPDNSLKIDDIDIWLKVYPLYLHYLNDRVVKSEGK